MMMMISTMVIPKMITSTTALMLNNCQSKPVRRATGEESGERAGIADVRERITMIQVLALIFTSS